MGARLVVWDRPIMEGETYVVECAGRMVDRFMPMVNRPMTVVMNGQDTFAIHAIDVEHVALDPQRDRVQIGRPPYAKRDWRLATWDQIVELEEGEYRLRYGKAEALLVLGPEDDE